jgi:hypothetical protein
MFYNVSTFHGYATNEAQVCWLDEGERNYYGNVSFGGFGSVLGADHVDSRALVIGAAGTGRGEHTFEHCTIGLDTRTRGAANASVEFLGGSPRNVFRNCLFPMDRDAGEPTYILVGSGGIDRFAWFQDCLFHNFGTTIAEVAGVNASAGGNVVMQRCTSIGATSIRNGAGPVFVDGGVPTAATTGIAVQAT